MLKDLFASENLSEKKENDLLNRIQEELHKAEASVLKKAIMGYVHRELTDKDYTKVHKKEYHNTGSRISYKLYYGTRLVGAVDITIRQDDKGGCTLHVDYTAKKKKQ